jgi:hypothetical protein
MAGQRLRERRSGVDSTSDCSNMAAPRDKKCASEWNCRKAETSGREVRWWLRHRWEAACSDLATSNWIARGMALCGRFGR